MKTKRLVVGGLVRHGGDLFRVHEITSNGWVWLEHFHSFTLVHVPAEQLS